MPQAPGTPASALPSEGRCAVIFTKPARPGRVKTRLIGDLSADQAAELHEAFVHDVAHRMAGGPFALRMAWALDDGEAVPDFPLSSGGTVQGSRQEGEDLGERLFLTLSRVAEVYPYVVALGSDHPTLPAERLAEAFRRLEAGEDLVVGPAQDGGYYLIAGSAETLQRPLFEGIPWSTETVFRDTVDRAKALGLGVSVLPMEHDVDRPEDLQRLAEELLDLPKENLATRRLLEAWGRLPARKSSWKP